jgi:NitT/TauT family transport system permease protein
MSFATLSIEELESMTRRAAPARTRWSVALLRRFAIRLVSLAAFVALWELVSDSKARFIVNFAHVPAPSAVAEAAVHFFQSPKAVRHIASSIKRVAAGFGIATLLAIPLGLLIGRARWAEETLFTPLEILRPIPGVAWIPLAILMFATSEQSMIFICFIGAFFPILISTIHGVETLDKRLIHAAQSLGARTWNIFLEVVLPGALPAIVTGLTIGTGSCWLLVVTAEMIAGQFGIGYYTWESYSLQKYPDIVVGMLIIGVLGMLSSAAVRFVGERLMPWHRHATHAR